MPLSDSKAEGLPAVVGSVELAAVRGEGAFVVHADAVAAGGFARAFVLEEVFGCYFSSESEGGEEGEEGESETHCEGLIGV